MAKIGNIDLDIVEMVEPTTTRSFKTLSVAGEVGSFQQNPVAYSTSWRIDGLLLAPSQAKRESLINLQTGEVVLIDIHEYGLFGYAKIRNVRLMLQESEADIWHYGIEAEGCPAVGHTSIQTAGIFLHDLDYRFNFRSFDPHTAGKFNLVYSADRLNADYAFFLDNDAGTIQTAVVEIQCGDDVSKFKLYYWTGSVWALIGDWGGADAWGASKTFTDPDGFSHTVTANRGNRGGTLTGIGTISRKLGTLKRILFSVTNMRPHTTDLSTKLGADQLRLRAIVEHLTAEAARPYVRITYIDGSQDYGVA